MGQYDDYIRQQILELREQTITAVDNEIAEALDWYRGDTEQFLRQLHDESNDEFDERMKFRVNICRDVISRTARLYDQQPGRTIGGAAPKEFTAEFERRTKRGRSNAIDQFTDAMTAYLGGVGQRIVWDPRRETFKWQPIMRNQIRLIQSPDDPTECIAAAILTSAPSTVDPEQPIEIMTVYTDEEIRRYVDDVEVDWDPNHPGDRTNPYGRIPIVWWRNEYEPTDFWPSGAYADLNQANRAINDLLSDLLVMADYQAFSVGVFTNCEAEDEVEIGPRRILEVEVDSEADGGFDFKTPSPNIPGVIAILQLLLDIVYQTHFLSQSPVRVQISSSGVELAMRRVDLMDMWRKRQSLFTDYEHDRILMCLRVWCTHLGVEMPDEDDIQINVDWKPPRIPIDEDLRWRILAVKLSNDLIDRAHALMEENEDLTLKEAVRQADEILENNRKWREATRGGSMDAVESAAASFAQANQQPQQPQDQVEQAAADAFAAAKGGNQ